MNRKPLPKAFDMISLRKRSDEQLLAVIQNATNVLDERGKMTTVVSKHPLTADDTKHMTILMIDMLTAMGDIIDLNNIVAMITTAVITGRGKTSKDTVKYLASELMKALAKVDLQTARINERYGVNLSLEAKNGAQMTINQLYNACKDYYSGVANDDSILASIIGENQFYKPLLVASKSNSPGRKSDNETLWIVDRATQLKSENGQTWGRIARQIQIELQNNKQRTAIEQDALMILNRPNVGTWLRQTVNNHKRNYE